MSKEEKRKKLLDRLKRFLTKEVIKELIKKIIEEISNFNQLSYLTSRQFNQSLNPLLTKLFPYNDKEYEEWEAIEPNDPILLEMIKDVLGIYDEKGHPNLGKGEAFSEYVNAVWDALELEKYIKPEHLEAYRTAYENQVETKIQPGN